MEQETEADGMFRSYAHMVRLLSAFRRNGIRVRVAGKLMEPEPAAEILTVREPPGRYMADYITDEKGSVREVRFDRIDPIRGRKRFRSRGK